MRKLIVLAVVGGSGYGAVRWWREHRRFGAGLVNRVVNPWLVRRRIVGGSRGELALIEHVGRKSGTVRQTPIHPMPTEDGYRIIVPIGEQSQWVRNVLAAGRCRLIVGDRVVELDEPKLEAPAEVPGVPGPVRSLFGWLGFRYLRLRTLVEAAAPEAPTVAVPAREREAVAV
ncbi:MAG TPA: nitroreductase family deazaflavin-dependent oxidoreductase [Candidatus Limnocylindria bacterium]